MKNITKRIFLKSLICSRFGWILRHDEDTFQSSTSELTIGEKFRIEQGIEIGKKAHSLYPNGKLITDNSINSATAETNVAVSDQNISTIFEATFLIDSYTAKADILTRIKNKWHLIEVKSSINDKKDFIDEMAYTAMVIKNAGLDISKVSLLLISSDFRLGMDNKKLFNEIDHSKEVLLRMNELQSNWKKVNEITSQPLIPKESINFECRKCKLFKNCMGKDITNHIFDIPRLSQSKFDKLIKLGVTCIEDIPKDFPLTDNQSIIKKSVQNNTIVLKDSLMKELNLVSWPAFYLDFETVMTAIPLYPDIAPYTQIPTQYSIHKCTDVDVIDSHFEFLADPFKDSRLDFAKRLIADLYGDGSIIVYSSFEKNIIKKLSEVFPSLDNELNSLVDRFIDLELIIKKNFYHPNFHGKTSIKNVLPALLPNLSYESLEISEGDSAAAAFAYLVLGKFKGDEAESVKKNLLDYCKQDTLAMVKLHKELLNMHKI